MILTLGPGSTMRKLVDGKAEGGGPKHVERWACFCTRRVLWREELPTAGCFRRRDERLRLCEEPHWQQREEVTVRNIFHKQKVTPRVWYKTSCNTGLSLSRGFLVKSVYISSALCCPGQIVLCCGKLTQIYTSVFQCYSILHRQCFFLIYVFAWIQSQ